MHEIINRRGLEPGPINLESNLFTNRSYRISLNWSMNIKNDTSTTVCLYSGFDMSLKSSSTFSWKFLSRLVISDIVGSCKTNLYGKRSAVSCTFLNEPMGKHPQPHLIWKKNVVTLNIWPENSFAHQPWLRFTFLTFTAKRIIFLIDIIFLKGSKACQESFHHSP